MSNKRSKKYETRVAKDITGGSVQPASGALPYWKNDVRGDFWLVEHKYTEAKSYSLKKQYFEEVLKNAFKDDRLPVVIVEFPNKPELKLAVIRYEDWLALDEYLAKEDNGSEP
jgi:hypothetical protein